MKSTLNRVVNIYPMPMTTEVRVSEIGNMVLEFEGKGTIDIGSLCYLRRNSEINRLRKNRAKQVDLKSYDLNRAKFVKNLIVALSVGIRSGYFSANTIFEHLQLGFMPYINWADSQEIYESFYNQIEARQVIRLFNEYLRGRLDRNEIKSATAVRVLRSALVVVSYILGVDNLLDGVNVVQKKNSEVTPVAPASESAEAKTLSICKSLFDRLSAFVVDHEKYPFCLKLPKYLGANVGGEWVFPVARSYLSQKDHKSSSSSKKFIAYDFVEGRLATLEEMEQFTTRKYAWNLRKSATDLLSRANSDNYYYHRRDMAILAHNAFVYMFLANTGINFTQLSQLWWEGDYNLGVERQGFRTIKWRAKGRMQSFEIQSGFFSDFKKYISLRKYLLRENENNYLFFGLGNNRKSEIRQIRAGTIGYFYSTLRRIDPDLPKVTPRQWRASKADWMLRNQVPVSVAATILQNSESVVRASYSMGSPTTHMQEMSQFLSRMSDVVVDREAVIENSIKSPLGVCSQAGKPNLIGGGGSASPDCKSPEGCLFCDKHRVHADEVDARKLLSCRYCIQKIASLAPSVEYFESAFGAVLSRIEEILSHIEKLCGGREILERVIHSVEVLGELDAYWAGKLELLIHLDLVTE